MESFDSLSHNNNVKLYHVAWKAMARHPEVCCILLAVSFIVFCKYGYSIQTKPVIVPPRTPSRFFPLNSLVKDFPYGAMEPVTSILADNEFIFIMFYAPWCSRSKVARAEFQKAARAMQGEVKFVSINCSWKEGDCRRRLKFPYFPQFYVYHTHLNGFRFQGIIGAEHMVKFLDNLRFPLTFIYDRQRLKDFISSQETSVVGYFDYGTSPEPPGFQQFYYAAMRICEQDPIFPPKFAVVNSKQLGEMFDLRSPSRVVITRRFNITLKFPLVTKLTSTNIVQWVMKNSMKPLVSWVIPPGMKSLLLSSQLDKGPVLLHFTRLDPLYGLHHSLTLLEKSALAYNNCGRETDISESLNSTVYKGLAASKFFLQTLSMCDNLRRQRKQFLYTRTCCVSVGTRGETNSSKGGAVSACEICQHYDSMTPLQSGCTMNLLYPQLKMSAHRPVANICAESVKNYNVNRHTSICCGVNRQINRQYPGKRKSVPGRRATDYFMEVAKERSQRHACCKLRLHASQSLPAGLFPTHAQVQSVDWMKSAGLACATNQTLFFAVMDIKYHMLFAKRLGVNFAKDQLPPGSSITVLIDKKNEWHSFMKEPFSENSIDIFLHNYTQSLLSRHQNSEASPQTCDNHSAVCVTDLTTHTFHAVVMDTSKDVLVLFYASWCGFCTSLSHVYLALARYFISAKSIIFTRIDADRNDLPWEFTVDVYPTLIFFPAKRKADSVVFPNALPKTLPNLIKFVLRHSSQVLRLDTARGICSMSCIRRNRREVSFTIVELYKHIRKIKRKVPQTLLSLDSARNQIDTDLTRTTKEFRIQLLLSQYIFLKKQLSKTEQQVKSAKLLEDMLSKSSEMLSLSSLEYFNQQHRTLLTRLAKTAENLSTKPLRDEL
ncbi:thioredoxin domain-containing protein 11-like [Liolophura sinensis]|uniref:thioredoxin domain-containing protein 11-like n=1 Tax=Liolophura sinensis TaxID=3198878 RepID=UPI0031589722